jgi:surface protein
MALAHKRSGTRLIVAGNVSGYSLSGGEFADGIRFDWVETEVDTTISGNTASDQYRASYRFINFNTSGVVGWGDGSYDEYEYQDGKSTTHTYASGGVYRVRYGKTGATGGQIPLGVLQDGTKKTDITHWGEFSEVPIGLGFGASMTLSGTTISATDKPDPNASAKIDCQGLFSNVPELETLPSAFDVSGTLINAREMFNNCVNFNSEIDYGWTSITNTRRTFFNCQSFNNGGSDSIKNLPFGSTATSMDYMFANCFAFNQPVTNWDTSNATNMTALFSGCTIFNQDVGNFDVSSVTGMTTMFAQARAFNNGGVGGVGLGLDSWTFPAGTTSLNTMFWRCNALNQYLGSWNVSPTITQSMFQECTVFNNGFGSGVSNGGVGVGMDNWDMSSCTKMAKMFNGAVAFNTYIGSWNTGLVTDMSDCFYGASTFNQDIGGWDTSSVTNMNDMIRDAVAFNNGGQDLDTWDVSSVTNFSGFAYGATAFDASCNWSLPTTGDVNFGVAFLVASSFTGRGLENWNVERVTTFGQCFQGSSLNFALTHPNYWEMRPGVNVFYAFRQTPLNGGQATGVGGRNFEMRFSTSASDSYNLSNMFAYCGDFNQDVSTDATNNYWDVSRVTNMSAMFRFCSKFNQDISNWDTSACTNMSFMFDGCTIFNQPIGSWNTSNVTSFSSTFKSCPAFNQDLSGWSIASLTTASVLMSSTNAFNTTNYDLLLDSTTGWASQSTIQNNVTLSTMPQYTAGGNAEAGRNLLTGTYGWTITDGGPV